MAIVLSLSKALREASAGTLPDGWLYLSSRGAPTPDSRCLLVVEDDWVKGDDDSDVPQAAVIAGYPVEGLDTATLESTASWVKQFASPPSDELLVESFNYYWRFDAFLPFPGSPDPPPAEEARLNEQRAFYECLGEERSTVSCRHQDCGRGAIELSVFCRVHHFENVRRIPCPFSD